MVPFTRGYAHVRKQGRGVEKEGQHQVPTRWVCLMAPGHAGEKEGGREWKETAHFSLHSSRTL